jgi:hypothetical protein
MRTAAAATYAWQEVRRRTMRLVNIGGMLRGA